MKMLNTVLGNLKKTTPTVLKQACVVGSIFLFAACGGSTNATSPAGSESAADGIVDSTTIFPSDLAIASPTDTTSSSSTDLTLSSVKFSSTSPSFVPTYAAATAAINRVLGASTAALCTFDPEQFLVTDHDAGCAGPMISYEGHPDATSSSDPRYDGQLPTGDVGLWTSEDAVTGQACAAAQLNSRMKGVSSKSLASLMGLASMVCVINDQGYSMPSNSTLDLTADMNALGIADVTFNSINGATITESNATGSSVYSYHMEFTYAPSSGSYDIVVDMEHTPGASAMEYSGKLSYLVNDTFSGGNCPTGDMTNNASLQYVRNAVDDMDVQVRSADFCGHDSDGRNADNLVDPSNKYDASFNPTGWGNNFNILTANYDPTSLSGNYSYTWQAGPMDGNSRVFNLTEVELAAGKTALAFYGYGDDVETTDGSITGFICNWAGPNNSHSLNESAQYQLVEYYAAAGTWLSVDDNIGYAPTVACTYDGTGSFTYDSDVDGTVDTDPATAIANDLFLGQDVDGDGVSTIEETISDSGFTLPTI